MVHSSSRGLAGIRLREGFRERGLLLLLQIEITGINPFPPLIQIDNQIHAQLFEIRIVKIFADKLTVAILDKSVAVVPARIVLGQGSNTPQLRVQGIDDPLDIRASLFFLEVFIAPQQDNPGTKQQNEKQRNKGQTDQSGILLRGGMRGLLAGGCFPFVTCRYAKHRIS